MSSNHRTIQKKLTEKQLELLIEEATIDCYEDVECVAGFSTMMEDNLPFPFSAKVIGEEVTVVEVFQENNDIKAICNKKDQKYKVSILNVELNDYVRGSEWIEAYREWTKRR